MRLINRGCINRVFFFATSGILKLQSPAMLLFNNQGFVFASDTGEPLNEGNRVRRHFKPILGKEGLPDIRLYDLRHTCTTLLLSQGVNPKIVSERLGHASTTLTMDVYSHVLPDMQKVASGKLQDLIYSND
jgi:integrase